MSKCAFCMRTAKLTGEHLWSDWMNELFPDKKFFFWRQWAGDKGLSVWERNSLDEKAKVVCRTCNNGWMSALENEHARPAMRDLILSKDPIVLSSARIASIAAFAFKSCVIADHMNRNKVPFFSLRTRLHFAKTLEIPLGVQMWLGCISALDIHRGIFRASYGYSPPEAVNGFKLYTFTYGIGRLCYQVTSARWVDYKLSKVCDPHLTQNNQWDSFSVPCWPCPRDGISWPPMLYLSNKTLQAFSHRWKRFIAPARPLPR